MQNTTSKIKERKQAGRIPGVAAVAICSAGLALRLRSIAEDECGGDDWMAKVLRQSANKIERMDRGLRLIRSGGGSPEERRAFCREAGIGVADSDGMARAAMVWPNVGSEQRART